MSQKLSGSQLANVLEVSPSYISQLKNSKVLESDKHGLYSLTNLKNLTYLKSKGVNLESIMSGEEIEDIELPKGNVQELLMKALKTNDMSVLPPEVWVILWKCREEERFNKLSGVDCNSLEAQTFESVSQLPARYMHLTLKQAAFRGSAEMGFLNAPPKVELIFESFKQRYNQNLTKIKKGR